MLILNPRLVRFGASNWMDVTSITIDRLPHRTTEDWSDHGAFPTHADVPEQKIRIAITQELARDDIDAPIPGETADLTFHTSPTRADAGRTRVSTSAVILSVQHELSQRKGAIRTITLAAISPDGATDPITTSDAS